jgi:hypothetical protein
MLLNDIYNALEQWKGEGGYSTISIDLSSLRDTLKWLKPLSSYYLA